ncbi:STAS domain-containing protein [Geomicrobium sp. JCM 19039]|uniref:STAS domain-containing protein n=1 Tax=Geomicrobium sp. JCM 19039 TaxID=1460636 RepID=UPI00045F1188|nr:STAS domain-containing protein [Geomicrobium sp. JCM 19039]GAK11926.1 RsbR, positive regulator of sigma-B [Geomicrobium sp. JCM 19039]
MSQNDGLYEFMMRNSRTVTERWYEKLDKNEGVYASRNQEVIDQLKEQNHAFHPRFFTIFNSTIDEFQSTLEPWVREIARDEYHQNTPIHLIIREFAHNQRLYEQLLEEYFEQFSEERRGRDELDWTVTISEAMNTVIQMFAKAYDEIAESRNLAQQRTIAELSAPVLLLTKHTALLPIVGDIDTYRAKIMLEHTLQQCAEKQVSTLFMDLSGVPIVDTMVAQQLFQLIQGLRLLGVHTILSGLRPEIAQTAVQLGIQFDEVSVRSSLSQAIHEKGLL